METQSRQLPSAWIDRIFTVFHGRFGDQFYKKFSSGVEDENGLDGGIENAKKQWARMLGGVSPERITRGLNAEYRYPPSCDEFRQNCKSIPAEHRDPSTLLEKKIDRMTQKSNAQIMAENVRGLNGVDDPHRWARNIIDNPNKYTNAHAIACAKKALGMEV